MNRKETAQIIAILRAAYPRQAISADQYKQMVSVWAGVLADVPFEIGQRATETHCRESKWFPAVSEIRDAAIGSREMKEAEDRRQAWRLVNSWGCCLKCHTRPCQCGAMLETEAAGVPQLEEG